MSTQLTAVLTEVKKAKGALLKEATSIQEQINSLNQFIRVTERKNGISRTPSRRRRGKLTASGRKAIVAAQKKRWARVRAEKRTPRQQEAS